MTLRYGVLGALLLVVGACSADAADTGPAGAGTSNQSNTGSGSSGSAVTEGTGGSGVGVIDAAPPEPEECDSVLEVIYRDFDDTHLDMERPNSGWGPAVGMIEATLDANRLPIFKSGFGDGTLRTDGTFNPWVGDVPMIESAATFDQWYRTSDVNVERRKPLELVEDPPGSGEFVFDSGTEGFFPLGPGEGLGASPATTGRNFLFTTEIHLLFEYRAHQRFTFRGDDDLWIFVNGRLALDLGGLHVPAEGTIDFDAQAAALGISPGGSYNMDVFHAERHTWDSNFRIHTNISCFTPVLLY